MTTLGKIISPARKTYAIECDNGSFEIDGCRFAIFPYDHEYVRIPGCPVTPEVLQWHHFTDKEIETIWVGFKKFASKFANDSKPIKFKKYNKMYRFSNYYIALYCEDSIVVLKSNGIIKSSDLFFAGFTNTLDVSVPLSDEHFAYYDKTNNTLICGW